MNLKKLILSTLISTLVVLSVDAQKLPTKSRIILPQSDLYEVFKNPDSKYRPYVRWWLNGLRIDKDEILRELDLMKGIGIGGAEINSIAFPGDCDPTGYDVKPYLSDQWVELIKTAVNGGKERGLVCDMIGGSGWPFGGEFLPRDKQLQMIYPETIDVDGKLLQGDNKITVKVTTLLGNYAKSLKNNRTAQRYAWTKDYQPVGMSGPVKLY